MRCTCIPVRLSLPEAANNLARPTTSSLWVKGGRIVHHVEQQALNWLLNATEVCSLACIVSKSRWIGLEWDEQVGSCERVHTWASSYHCCVGPRRGPSSARSCHHWLLVITLCMSAATVRNRVLRSTPIMFTYAWPFCMSLRVRQNLLMLVPAALYAELLLIATGTLSEACPSTGKRCALPLQHR